MTNEAAIHANGSAKGIETAGGPWAEISDRAIATRMEIIQKSLMGSRHLISK
jgi:hypothetical protein